MGRICYFQILIVIGRQISYEMNQSGNFSTIPRTYLRGFVLLDTSKVLINCYARTLSRAHSSNGIARNSQRCYLPYYRVKSLCRRFEFIYNNIIESLHEKTNN